uniref:Peptidoglycan binding-like domain-containing protein n=1 Tax=Canis lupus dingo TaxID=286419 RepID=A0A8C0K9Q8_CANLU
MWPAVLCALCLLPSCLALPLPREAGGMSEPQWKQAQDYLKRFYPSDSKTRDADSFKTKLKEMQKFFRLPVTGILNSRTIEIMQKPRCGVPDVAHFSLFPNRPKWTSEVITYRLVLLWLVLGKAAKPSLPKFKCCVLLGFQDRIVHPRLTTLQSESISGKGFGNVEQRDPTILQESSKGNCRYNDWLCKRR